MKHTFFPIVIALLALNMLSGCAKSRAKTQDSEQPSSSSSSSGISRLFTNHDYPPEYPWDGTTSTGSVTASVDVTYARSQAALKALGFIIKDESKLQADSGQIVATKDDHTDVTVDLQATGPGTTQAHVKFGAVGDRTSGERILDEMKKPSRNRK